jgi:hypothetical protein
VRDVRRPLQERSQLAPRPLGGRGLERVAAREHESDHRAGQPFAEGERPGHRQQRDRVDADVAAAQRRRHRCAERTERHRDRDRPDDVAGARHVEEVRAGAGDDRRCRQQRQDRR